jgi:hypothetical protein
MEATGEEFEIRPVKLGLMGGGTADRYVPTKAESYQAGERGLLQELSTLGGALSGSSHVLRPVVLRNAVWMILTVAKKLVKRKVLKGRTSDVCLGRCAPGRAHLGHSIERGPAGVGAEMWVTLREDHEICRDICYIWFHAEDRPPSCDSGEYNRARWPSREVHQQVRLCPRNRQLRRFISIPLRRVVNEHGVHC